MPIVSAHFRALLAFETKVGGSRSEQRSKDFCMIRYGIFTTPVVCVSGRVGRSLSFGRFFVVLGTVYIRYFCTRPDLCITSSG